MENDKTLKQAEHTIHLKLNGLLIKRPNNMTLAELLSGLALDGQLFATEVNREIIPQGEYGHYILKDGDAVEIVRAVGGG